MQGRAKNCLPIEALCEFKVFEILNDGQEIVERFDMVFSVMWLVDL